MGLAWGSHGGRLLPLLRILVFLSPAVLASAVRSHCTEEIAPTVEMVFPEDGMSVQTVCWPVFQECFTDTFQREDLQAELVAEAEGREHAAFLYVDSLRNRLGFDSVYYQGQLYFVDTFQVEDVWLSVHAELKGRLSVKRFHFRDRFVYVAGKPFATTYTALIDTPFLAFFDAYDSIHQLGIGPLDGCFFEPSAYLVKDGRIEKKSSDESERMPGVTVGLEEFFRASSLTPIPTPPVRARHSGSRKAYGAAARTVVGARVGGYFDLRGRRWARKPAPGVYCVPGR